MTSGPMECLSGSTGRYRCRAIESGIQTMSLAWPQSKALQGTTPA